MTVRTAEDFTIFCGDWCRRLQQDSFLNCTVYCYLFRKLLNQIPTFVVSQAYVRMMMIMRMIMMMIMMMIMIMIMIMLQDSGMISIRKWLYKPRRDDKSLFAKFW